MVLNIYLVFSIRSKNETSKKRKLKKKIIRISTQCTKLNSLNNILYLVETIFQVAFSKCNVDHLDCIYPHKSCQVEQWTFSNHDFGLETHIDELFEI